MRRLFKALLVLMTVTLLAGSAFGGGKDLGDLLAKNNGSYGAYYDQRLWPQPFFDVQYPNGGVRLYLTLGVFSTAAERDAATALIKEVVFENVSGGIAYALTKPELYTQDDKAGLMGGGITYGVDYYVWVGNYHQAQG
ncbi:MAG: hypothetical protein FJY85_22325, partial [Deltaproteobacteria bacterium]|nr:hypothetical protein [Deltaproteobacteria bacterium]